MGSDWDSPKKLKGWIPLIVVVSFVAVLILTGTLDDFIKLKDDVTESVKETVKEVSTPTEKESTVVERPKTLEEKIKQVTDYNTKIRYEQTEFGKTLIVEIPPKFSRSLFSDGDWVISANMDMGKIMQMVFTNSNYDDIDIAVIVVEEEFTDEYGVTNEESAYAVSLSRDTASKINWSGFIWGNPNLLPYHSIVDTSKGDGAYLHPSFNVN